MRREFGILGLALWLILTAGPGLDAEEEAKASSANFHVTEEDGRAIIRLEFSDPLVGDKSFPIAAREEELPFSFDRPFPFEAVWLAPDRLRLELPWSLRELTPQMDQRPLKFLWKPGFPDAAGRPLALRGWIKTKPESIPLILYGPDKDKDGQVSNTLAVTPLSAGLEIEDKDHRISFKLTFNQDMVRPPSFGRPAELTEAPFVLNPPLPLTGAWTDARTLKMAASLTPEEYWTRVCDQPFTFRWKTNWTSLAGLQLTGSARGLSDEYREEFYISRFSLLYCSQIGPVRNGRAIFELSFNKPVSHAELMRRLKLKAMPRRDDSPFPSDSTWREREPSDPKRVPKVRLILPAGPNQAAEAAPRLSVEAKPGDRFTLDLTGLISADQKGRLGKAVWQTYVGNEFSTLFHPSIPQESNSYRRSSRYELELEYPWRPYIEFILEAPIFSDHLAEYIKLEPPLDFSAAVVGRDGDRLRVFINPPYAGDLKINLLPGLTTLKGQLIKTVSSRFKLTIDYPGYRPRFDDQPLYLAPSQPPFLMLPVIFSDDELRLRMWRIYEQNLPVALNLRDEEAAVRLRQSLRLSEALPDRLIRLNQGLTIGDDDRRLDLGRASGYKPGLYIMQATRGYKTRSERDQEAKSAAEPYEPEDGYRMLKGRDLAVSLSDLGLAARIGPLGTTVWVVGLTDGQPVPGVRVEIYDQSSRIVAEGLTGADGLFQAGPDAAGGLFALAKKDGDQNYLMLNAPPTRRGSGQSPKDAPIWPGDLWSEMPLAGFINAGAERDYLIPGGLEAYVHLSRKHYRSGDTVSALAVIRDARLNRPPAGTGLTWRLMDAQGRTLIQHTRTGDRSDLAKFRLAAGLPLGRYQVTVSRAEEATPLGQADFWLHRGAAGLKAIEMKFPEADPAAYQVARPSTPPPPKPKREPRPANRADWVWATVPVNKGGLTAFSRFLSYWRPGPDALTVGVQVPAEPVLGRGLILQAAVRGLTGPVAGRKAKVTIFQEVPRYVNILDLQGSANHRPPGPALAEAAGFEVELDKYGRGLVEFFPAAAGTYEAVIEDPNGGWRSSRRFEIFGAVPPEEELTESLDLSFHRPHYRPGETAELLISPPFSGPIWLTIESDKSARHLILNNHDRRKPAPILVTAAMAPNAWVTAMAVAPAGHGRLARRALGAARLDIDPGLYELKLDVEPINDFQAGGTARIKVRLAGSDGRPQSGRVTAILAGPDEHGQSADPAAFFSAPRKLPSRHFDMYDPRRGQAAAADSSPAGPDRLQLAPDASAGAADWDRLVTVETDRQGQAVLELAVPRWTGPARLTILADSSRQFGLLSRPALIKPSDSVGQTSQPPRKPVAAADYHFSPNADLKVVRAWTLARSYLREISGDDLNSLISAAWPLLTDYRLSSIGRRSGGGDPALKNAIGDVFQHLALLQTASGGFAGQAGAAQVDEWLSLHAVHFLLEAGELAEAPADLQKKAGFWLDNFFYSDNQPFKTKRGSELLSAKNYACYLLTRTGECPERYPIGVWAADMMSPSGLIFLVASAARMEGGPRPLELIEKMELDISPRGGPGLESPARNLALKLLVWAEIAPQSQVARKLALQAAEDGLNGRWQGPHEHGVAALALGRYLEEITGPQPESGLISSQSLFPLVHGRGGE
jgi:hypothetical protein